MKRPLECVRAAPLLVSVSVILQGEDGCSEVKEVNMHEQLQKAAGCAR